MSKADELYQHVVNMVKEDTNAEAIETLGTLISSLEVLVDTLIQDAQDGEDVDV